VVALIATCGRPRCRKASTWTLVPSFLPVRLHACDAHKEQMERFGRLLRRFGWHASAAWSVA